MRIHRLNCISTCPLGGALVLVDTGLGLQDAPLPVETDTRLV